MREAPTRRDSPPHLCIAQHRVSSLNSRHGEWEPLQPPQQAAEVIIATHSQCQGLFTCVGELAKRRHSGRSLDLTEPQHHLGSCHDSSYCGTRAPPAGHRRCRLAAVGKVLSSLAMACHAWTHSGSYLFRALDQCIKETTHIVDTGIWDVSMAKEHRSNEGIRGYVHWKQLPLTPAASWHEDANTHSAKRWVTTC